MSSPNVLLIVLDAVRADHISCYGHDRETTPHIDELADDGIKYEHAFANSNWTGGSHPSMFTGLLPSQSGVYGDEMTLPTDTDLLSELLCDAGYRTFATSAGVHIRSDRGYNRGFDEFHETYRVRPSTDFIRTLFRDYSALKQLAFSGVYGHDNYTLYKFDRLQRWLLDGDDPFFAFINAKTAHNPYNPPRPYRCAFDNRLERPRFEFVERALDRLGLNPGTVRGVNDDRLRKLSWQYPILTDEFEPSEEELTVLTAWYDGAIRYLDEQIGQLLKFMRTKQLLSNTHVIVTADHGELFGEHGLEKHHYSLYEPVLHVPLVIYPAQESPLSHGVVSDPVSLADLYPTILNLAGAPGPDRPSADSLISAGLSPTNRCVYAEVGSKSADPVRRHSPGFDDSEYDGPIQSARDEEHKLIRQADGSVELYRWRDDPAECHELADEKPAVVDRLISMIERNLNPMNDTALNEDIDDPTLREHLQDLGYM
jgi:arylsulfatase A-like enzyme